MEAVAITLVLSMFADGPDPRAANAHHQLVDMLATALMAALAGADKYPGIVEYGQDHKDWLRQFMLRRHGIPLISTFPA